MISGRFSFHHDCRVWFQSIIHDIYAVYGQQHEIKLTDLRLVYASFETNEYAISIDGGRSDQKAKFCRARFPDKDSPWGHFRPTCSSQHAR